MPSKTKDDKKRKEGGEQTHCSGYGKRIANTNSVRN